MANTLRFKRGLASGIPTALAGEPLFTTDTFDLYIGNGTTNTRFQKYIASGATTQILRGDGSLYTFPLAISSPSNGQVLKYNGTSWVNDSDSGITGSGAAGQVAYFTGATTQGGSNNLFWDNTNGRLGINTNTPILPLSVVGSAIIGQSNAFNTLTVGKAASGNWGANIIIHGYNNTFKNFEIGVGSQAGNFTITPSTADGGNTYTTPVLSISRVSNISIGSTTDSGEKLQVTGTMKVTGASVFGSSISTNGGWFALRSSAAGALGYFLQTKDWLGGGSTDANPALATESSYGLNFYTNGSTTLKMRLDASGNLGLGTSTPLTVTNYRIITTNGTSGSGYATQTNGTLSLYTYSNANGSTISEQRNLPIFIETNGVLKATLDASGNLGLGVTPSAWNSGYKALQVLNLSLFGTSSLDLNLGSNVFVDSTGNYKYIGNGFASLYNQYLGKHYWSIAANNTSGAGAAITFTQAMTLDASGNLGVGTASPYANLDLGKSGANNIILRNTSNAYNLGYIGNAGGRIDIGFSNSNGSLVTLPYLSVTSLSNVLIGSTSDTGEKFQVTGTAKITGATTIGGGSSATSQLDVTSNSNANGITLRNRTGNDYAFFNWRSLDGSELLAESYIERTAANTATLRHTINNGSGVANYLTIASTGAATFSNALTVTGNLTVDTNTLFVDATNNRVGILTTTPSTTLDVGGNATIGLTSTTGYSLVVQNSGANDTTGIKLTSGGTDNGYFITAYNSVSKYASLQAGDNLAYKNIVLNLLGGNVGIGISPTYKLHVSGTGYFSDNVRFPNLKGVVFVQSGGSLLGSISMDSSDQVTIDNNGFFGLSVGTSYNLLGGNTGIGTSSFGTSATRTFAMLNGTAPSTSPTDIFQMYSNDITAGNAAPHFRTENGAVVKIYQQTSAVGTASWVGGAGSTVTDLDTFDGYTIGQIVKALRNAGFLQ